MQRERGDAPRAQPARAGEPVATLPPQPKTVRETGLELALLVELAAKAMYASAKTPLPVLAGKLRLSIGVMREVLDAMVAEQMAEAGWGGDTDLDLQYHLTAVGKQRAAEYLARCRYAGPAPVTLAGLPRSLPAPVGPPAPTRRASAPPKWRPRLPTTTSTRRCASSSAPRCSRAARCCCTARPAAARARWRASSASCSRAWSRCRTRSWSTRTSSSFTIRWCTWRRRWPRASGENQRSVDTRWTLCQRPVVQVGAELSQEMLDLRYDSANGVYQAPPHLHGQRRHAGGRRPRAPAGARRPTC